MAETVERKLSIPVLLLQDSKYSIWNAYFLEYLLFRILSYITKFHWGFTKIADSLITYILQIPHCISEQSITSHSTTQRSTETSTMMRGVLEWNKAAKPETSEIPIMVLWRKNGLLKSWCCFVTCYSPYGETRPASARPKNFVTISERFARKDSSRYQSLVRSRISIPSRAWEALYARPLWGMSSLSLLSPVSVSLPTSSALIESLLSLTRLLLRSCHVPTALSDWLWKI